MPHHRAPDPWVVGDAYEQYVGRWSRPVAARFIAALGLPIGLRWLDVGCGTGALCNAILDQAAPASVVGVEPSAGFLATARQRLADRVACAIARYTCYQLCRITSCSIGRKFHSQSKIAD